MEIKINETELAAKIAAIVIEAITPLIAQAKSPSDDNIFDVRSLAAFLKVDAGWIYRQIHKKNIPFFKAGKYVRFRKSEIEDWLTKQKKGPQ